MLAIAIIATAMVVLPVMVPIALGLGALAGSAYAVHRFYQSSTTTAEKALKAWHGDPSMHTKKFLSSLQPWINRSTVGPEGCQIYRRLMACMYVTEMQPKAQAIPQTVIDKIEALVK